MKPVTSLLFFFGVLIALFGIGVDYLLPDASPGINLPQLLVILAGLAVSLLATRVQSARFQRAVTSRLGRSLAAALIVALTTIIALEVALAAADIRTHYRDFSTDTTLTARPMWTCGAAGCHYVYEAVQAGCAIGEFSGRLCSLNKQGYASAVDFARPADWEGRQRILLLGDSFTWGLSSTMGWSFAEFLERELPDALIWNTGIPGAGTNQALLAFEVYAPVLRPQLTILGFVLNDFNDNLLPIDSWLNALDADGQAIHIRKYAIDERENVTALDLETLGFISAHGRQPPSHPLERYLGVTRLGTLLLRFRDMTAGPTEPQVYERRRQVTKQYLLELKQAVSASGSELLVIMVPYAADVKRIESPNRRFRIATELMRELEIPYLNPIHILDPVSDYYSGDEGHWTNSGHQKVGELLSECVQRFLASGAFADCAHIVTP
ncbi:MAG: SGNH/GDSL hydrolase family protein [Chloroflexi bacterium]|nr:SGNH/GDSL hydrolase family protein [Chloroflexota bacterium]